MKNLFVILFCLLTHIVFSQESKFQLLEKQLKSEIDSASGKYGIAFKDVGTGREILINPHLSFHAASTMKTPVMIEVFNQVSSGKFSLTDSLLIKNEFRSIVDGSIFHLDSLNDSDHVLYRKIGQKVAIKDLVYDMIIVSSNFATNLIIDLVGAGNVNQTMRRLGANDIQVLRGVEDSRAFEKGMNNTTTSYDLMLLFDQIAKGTVVDKSACDAMVAILLDQKFNSAIPALLPTNVKVAHKTGSITKVQHDSGIVFLPDGRKYVLVILTSDWSEKDQNLKFMAQISRKIYDALYQ